MKRVSFTYQPLDNASWVSDGRKVYENCRFRSRWSNTIDELNREIFAIGVFHAVLEIDVSERDIRRDGLPRSDARPKSPRVRLSFDHPDIGPLQYPCDTYSSWQDNIRAIAKTLSAQRAMDRYGATRHHQQYSGWKQLPASATETMDAQVAAEFIASHGNSGINSQSILSESISFRTAYREAARRLHPDTGGDDDSFKTLTRAKAALYAHHGELK